MYPGAIRKVFGRERARRTLAEIASRAADTISHLSEDDDPSAAIDRAMREAGKASDPVMDGKDALMQQFIDRLHPKDFEILRQSKAGKPYFKIAASMGMDPTTVRTLLVQIYTDMRMWMEFGGPDGDGEPMKGVEESPPIGAAIARKIA